MFKLAYPVATPDISGNFMGLQGPCFENNLHLIAENGYEGIELFLSKANSIPENFAFLLSKYNLELACIGTTFITKNDGLSLSTSDDSILIKAIDRINSFSDFAASYGCKCISIGKARGQWANNPDAEKQQIKALRDICSYAKQKNVEILIEPQNIDQIDNINSVSDALKFLEKAGSDNLFLHLDTLHLSKTESSVRQGFSDAGELVRFIHISDSSRSIPGSGDIDFSGIFGLLKKLNYEGFISPEIKQSNEKETVHETFVAIRNMEKSDN